MNEPYKERNKPCAKCKAPGPHSFQFAGLFNHFNLRCMTCGYSWTYVAEELWDEAMKPKERLIATDAKEAKE